MADLLLSDLFFSMDNLNGIIMQLYKTFKRIISIF